jgi:hypothetical protein
MKWNKQEPDEQVSYQPVRHAKRCALPRFRADSTARAQTVRFEDAPTGSFLSVARTSLCTLRAHHEQAVRANDNVSER